MDSLPMAPASLCPTPKGKGQASCFSQELDSPAKARKADHHRPLFQPGDSMYLLSVTFSL